MATGASHQQLVMVNGGSFVTLGELYSAFIAGGIGAYTINFADPSNPSIILGQRIDTVYNHKSRMGVRLVTEDDRTVVVAATGYVLDPAEDAPARMTIKHPSDAKCIIGPNLSGSDPKLIVRNIVSRSFLNITAISLPVPNMIADSGFVIVC